MTVKKLPGVASDVYITVRNASQTEAATRLLRGAISLTAIPVALAAFQEK